VAKCMTLLMNSDIEAERYIISAENRYYKDITAKIAEGFGLKPPSLLARPWMMGVAWRWAALVALFTGKAPAIDKTSAEAASKVVRFDNTRIKKAVGIEFRAIDETVAEVCAAMRNN